MDIVINQGFKRYRMKADLILKNETVEQYKIYPAENPDLFVVLENNRPLIRERYRLKKRRIDWRQLSGKTIGSKTLSEIISKIERNGIEEMEQPLPYARSTAKARKDQFSKMDHPTLGETSKIRKSE